MSQTLIAERRKTHGDWPRTAGLAQRLKRLIADELAAGGKLDGPRQLFFEQREALDNILVKIARIVSGDADHADHWRDIAGYALLGIRQDQLERADDDVGHHPV